MRGIRGGDQLVKQVSEAVKKINFVGQSKREDRNNHNGKTTGIHSLNQIGQTLATGKQFARWVRAERGVKDLYKLKRADYRAFIEYLRLKGVSNGYLIAVETNLRMLGKGMEAVSEARHFLKRDWIPKHRLVDSKSREVPRNRSLSAERVQDLMKKLPEEDRKAAILQSAFGLRLREAAMTRAAFLKNGRDGQLRWVTVTEANALNAAKGVTKAGRPREVVCLPEWEPLVRRLLVGKKTAEFLTPKYNALKSAYYRAGVGGSHAFRHTYARQMLHRTLARKGIEKEGLRIIGAMMANFDQGKRKDTGLRHDNLYRETNAVIDWVHANLGHGKGRIDLAAVYMRG